jgi:hypothetical protein
MTPAYPMPRMFRRLTALLLALSCALSASMTGCATKKTERPLAPPEVVVAPYRTGDPAGEALWAVAPLRNESGTTFADPNRISDALIAAASEVRGVRVLPLNRTLAAMRSLNLRSIDTPAQARQLAITLGADAILVGTITAYDPYNPPVLGLNLALMPLDAPGAAAFDPRSLVEAPTDHDPAQTPLWAEQPLAIVSEHMDARNHQVLAELRNYAAGRHDPRDALTWEVYLASMPLYTRFVAHACVERLIQQEWIRVARGSGDGV